MKLIILALAIFSSIALVTPGHAATVPFVSCPTSTDGGNVNLTGKPIFLDVPSEVASQLALYVGVNTAFLAPRGLDCAGSQGTDGSTLSAYPAGSSTSQTPYISMIVNVSVLESNYFGLYFPKLVPRTAIQATASQLNLTVEQFAVPRYRADHVSYVNNAALEYVTPPGQDGFGNQMLSLPKSNELADYGLIAILPFAEGEVVMFGVQLPTAFGYLRPYILTYSKNCLLIRNGEPLCPLDSGEMYHNILQNQ